MNPDCDTVYQHLWLNRVGFLLADRRRGAELTIETRSFSEPDNPI